MSEKGESVETTKRVGILRKRGTASVVSNTSINQRIASYRTKSKLDSNPTSAKSVDDGGGMFLKRNKLIQDRPTTAPISPYSRCWGRGKVGSAAGVTISACPSSTTIDSRITATSHSSLSHKPGFIPAYIRNKTGTKNLVTVQMQSYKKQFNQIKKELADLQTKAVEYYKRYRESLVKLNKLNGTDEPPVIEELQIVGFKEKPPAETEQSPISPQKDLKVETKVSYSKIKKITDETIFADIAQQVHGIQVHSFELLQQFSDRLALINNQMKMVEKSAGDDTNLFPAKIQSLFEEVEKKILEEEDQQSTRIINFMTCLKQTMMTTQEDTNKLAIEKQSVTEEYETTRKADEHKIYELEMKIKDLEVKKLHEELRNVELAKAVTNEKSSVDELRLALTESQTKRDDRDNEFEKIVLKLKQAELGNKRQEKRIEDLSLEVIAKDKSIVELKVAIKSMQDKMMKYSNQIQKLESKASHTDEEFKKQMEQLKTKYDDEVKMCNALRFQVHEMNLAMADDFRAVRDENIKLKNSEKVLIKEIESLKLSLNEILYRKNSNEKQKMEDGVVRRELERRDEELNRLKTIIIEMKEELIKREILFAQKTREASDLENVVKQLENRDKVAKFQAEIERLQQLNEHKTREAEQLKDELNKTETALRLQEESLFMEHRLRKIRTELIQSLQENDDSTQHQISDLNTEVERRTYAVKQVKLHQEVSSKTEELENLFSTLGAKNLEVKRQDHIIKLLEETHERNQNIRVKLEGKIARLENENTVLKRFSKFRS